MSVFNGFEHIVRDSEPLAPFTWFRLGGNAEFFAEPTSVEELAGLVRRCKENQLPIHVLGGGSNLLVRDEGVRGLVLLLSAPAFGEISVMPPLVAAGGGAKLGHVIASAVREGLAGLEALAGIPGSVGGALVGNADASGTSIGQSVKSVDVMTSSGEIVRRDRDDLRFAYRESNLDELLVLRAEFELEPGDSRELTKRMQKMWILHKSMQPRGSVNLACIFKDVGGYSAAELIEQAGLRSAQVGGAAVSEEHANFIVAKRDCTSADVIGLIELLSNGVAERMGVSLERQMQIW